MSVEKTIVNPCSNPCNCLNAYIHSKVSTLNYQQLVQQLQKYLTAGKRKKVSPILQKLIYFKLEVDLLPIFLEILSQDDKHYANQSAIPAEDKKQLRLVYYLISNLAQAHNISGKHTDIIQSRLKLDCASRLRLFLSVRSFSGYIHSSANKSITLDIVRKIVKGEQDIISTDASSKDKKHKEAKKGHDVIDEILIVDGWLESCAFFEFRSRLASALSRNDATYLVNGILSPLELVSRNALSAALEFSYRQPDFMIKLMEENLKQIEEKYLVSDDTQKDANAKATEPIVSARKDKKEAKKPKSEKGSRRDSVAPQGPRDTTESDGPHSARREYTSQDHHSAKNLYGEPPLLYLSTHLNRQKCTYTTLVGNVSKQTRVFQKSLHHLVLDDNFQVSLLAIEGLLNGSWTTDINIPLITDNSLAYIDQNLKDLIVKILCDTLDLTFTANVGRPNNIPIRHKICRLALLLGEKYTKQYHLDDPEANAFHAPSVEKTNSHPLLRLRHKLVRYAPEFKGYTKLKALQAIIWLVYQEDSDFLTTTLMSQIGFLPFEIFDKLLEELIRRVQTTPTMAEMTLQLIDRIFRTHPSKINPEMLIDMWKTVMSIEGGKMKVINNIFDLLSSPQSNFSSHLFKVCFWALGEFGCELSSHYLRARAPIPTPTVQRNRSSRSASTISRDSGHAPSHTLPLSQFSSAGSKAAAIAQKSRPLFLNTPLLPLNSSTSSTSGGDGNNSSRLSPKESPKSDSPKSNDDNSLSATLSKSGVSGDHSLHVSQGDAMGDTSGLLSGSANPLHLIPKFCKRCGLRFPGRGYRFCSGCGLEIIDKQLKEQIDALDSEASLAVSREVRDETSPLRPSALLRQEREAAGFSSSFTISPAQCNAAAQSGATTPSERPGSAHGVPSGSSSKLSAKSKESSSKSSSRNSAHKLQRDDSLDRETKTGKSHRGGGRHRRREKTGSGKLLSIDGNNPLSVSDESQVALSEDFDDGTPVFYESVTPDWSFPLPAEETISLYVKSQSNFPIANPLMNLILMRLETAVIQCPWELKLICLEGLAKIAFFSDFDVKIHLFTLFQLFSEDAALGVSEVALGINQTLMKIMDSFEDHMNGGELTDAERLKINSEISLYCNIPENFCPLGLK